MFYKHFINGKTDAPTWLQLTDQLYFCTHCKHVFHSHTDRREDDIATFRPVVAMVSDCSYNWTTRVPMFKSEKGIRFRSHQRLGPDTCTHIQTHAPADTQQKDAPSHSLHLTICSTSISTLDLNPYLITVFDSSM